ncbi:hypothetical protein BDV95DRAFT_625943 [Massariosphaeria phaeospora]|uniref:Ubiquitin carboxyl-terminal hydrolase 14 n=1 Tax=Massariosphaeria phaeospora TaxID=100035 RepID=A0A7C8MM85_9PLEO|nr:hypothetical protein BDV95DRAFT_625943 [Massariosphaeria phaeospora]
MGEESLKRGRDASHRNGTPEVPAKRRRQLNEADLKLSKLYEDLAADDDGVRLEAAKQLIVRFSPESYPTAEEVEKALNRLIRGLCSHRKAARVGFCVTLTELLRQVLGQSEQSIPDLHHDARSIIDMVEEKTKVEGNATGQQRRDHLIGKLFGYKAIMQSTILVEPQLSLKCWNQLLDRVCGMARDIPWLREECGLVLVEALKSLQSRHELEECAKGLIQLVTSSQLAYTPEGVAIWLTVRADYEDILPENVWHQNDPLSKKERVRLAKILREDFRDASEQSKDEHVKSAGASPNPTFAWRLVLSEMLQRDQKSNDSARHEFSQFWLDTVDSNLFANSTSHERKSWGFKLFASLFAEVPGHALPALFSPNLMRTLINQSRKEDRFLHAASLAALKAIQARVQQDPTSALLIFASLTTKNGSIDLDKITKTKTLENILLSVDDETLRKIIRHIHSVLLRPETQEHAIADNRRQTIADMLLHIVRHYKRYENQSSDLLEKDNWLRSILEVMIDCAYFIPSQSARTSKIPLPPVSESTRKLFRERLSSCLTRLLGVQAGSRASFATMVVGIIRSKASSRSLRQVFKADEFVTETLEKAHQSLDTVSAECSSPGKNPAAEGFLLLYCLTLLQVYDGDGDAVLMLSDLESARKTMLQPHKRSETQGQNVFIEIILSFLGNTRMLFRKIAEEAFSIFISDICFGEIRSLTDILDTEENMAGQRELFQQDGEDVEDGVPSSDSIEEGSDVKMVEGEPRGSDDTGSDSGSSIESNGQDDESANEDDNEDNAELTRFNNLLAMTLQTSRLSPNSGASKDSSDGSDMDDEQMMALDSHLSKIFQQRSKITSKKKDREDAKQTVVQFKSRVLDLLAIYMEKRYSDPLTLMVLLPLLRRVRASANKQLAEKSTKLLKAPLPRPQDSREAWATLQEIHAEAKMGGGSIAHATVCSDASLHVVKVLMGLDKSSYARIADVYSESQKQWFRDKKSSVQPVLFTQFLNWSANTRKYKDDSFCGVCDGWSMIGACLARDMPRQSSGSSYRPTEATNFNSSRHRHSSPATNQTLIPAEETRCPFYQTTSPEDIAGALQEQDGLHAQLRPPGPTQSVYREDCTQCFDSIDDPSGLDVCLYCFNGGCTSERNHSLLHVSSASHPLVLNVKRTRKAVKRDEPPQKISKLAIAAETETDRYDTTAQVKCYECGVENVDRSTGRLSEVVDAVLKANTFARQEEVKAWEQELTGCEHTLCLEQDAPRQKESQSLGRCSECDFKENLWLCLACGNLGCGRAQFGGIGGNSHGLAHKNASGHSVAVKLGSLTADGTADIYCYACDEERIDPELPNHLMHWGINIKDRIKTEKSLTEMQVEQNLLWEFSMTTEDGKELKPLFGNSCYLNNRYNLPGETAPNTNTPAEDLETQLRKIADGLLSGRYSKPDSDVVASEHTPENPHQKGIAPAMLKHLIGRGHAEFSTMRQQDAFELLLHLLKLISRSQHVAPLQDPVEAFSCKKVRYRTDEQENVSIPVPIRRTPKDMKMGGTGSEEKEKPKEEFEPVTLKECLDIFTAEELVELTCGACGSQAGFTKKSMFRTFPAVLAVNARRFEIVNWVPTKQDVPVIVDDGSLSFDAYKSSGLQEGEEALPEDAAAGSGPKWAPNEAALGMLEAMRFPKVRCEKALHATGNSDPEAASNWLFAHMDDPDIDDAVDFDASGGLSNTAIALDPEKIDSLCAMGFNTPQARQALKETSGDMERAVDWLFSHPDAPGDFEEGSSSEVPAATTETTLAGSDKLPANFQLQSIVCHKGSSIHAGHYVAFIRKQAPDDKGASWVLFNDEKIAKAGDVEEMKKFAYVYFFRRL